MNHPTLSKKVQQLNDKIDSMFEKFRKNMKDNNLDPNKEFEINTEALDAIDNKKLSRIARQLDSNYKPA